MHSFIEQLSPAGALAEPAGRALLACLISFVLTMMFAPRVIRALISLKIGQPIRTAEEVHKLAELHGAKAGTPTMGGVLIVGSMTAATLLCARMNNPFIISCLFVTLALGLLSAMRAPAGSSGTDRSGWCAVRRAGCSAACAPCPIPHGWRTALLLRPVPYRWARSSIFSRTSASTLRSTASMHLEHCIKGRANGGRSRGLTRRACRRSIGARRRWRWHRINGQESHDRERHADP